MKYKNLEIHINILLINMLVNNNLKNLMLLHVYKLLTHLSKNILLLLKIYSKLIKHLLKPKLIMD